MSSAPRLRARTRTAAAATSAHSSRRTAAGNCASDVMLRYHSSVTNCGDGSGVRQRVRGKHDLFGCAYVVNDASGEGFHLRCHVSVGQRAAPGVGRGGRGCPVGGGGKSSVWSAAAPRPKASARERRRLGAPRHAQLLRLPGHVGAAAEPAGSRHSAGSDQQDEDAWPFACVRLGF
jgi:hypothetical protein